MGERFSVTFESTGSKLPNMSFHSHLYCKTLKRVTKAELVDSLHQALMQLRAAHKRDSEGFLDHRPAILAAEKVMAKAGHPGFGR